MTDATATADESVKTHQAIPKNPGGSTFPPDASHVPAIGAGLHLTLLT